MRRILPIIAGCVTVAILLTGCQIGQKNIVIRKELGSNHLMRINEEDLDIGAANLLMATYLNLYKQQYGDELLTSIKSDYSLYDYVKDITLNHLAKMMCMSELAKSKEIVLTESEQEKIDVAVTKFWDGLSKKDQETINVSKSEVKDLYERYALSEKVYEQLTEGSDREVSDEDARVMEIHQIFVTSKEQADKVATALASGSDFDELAATYNEANVSDRFIGREDVDDAIAEVVFLLQDDAISEAIATEDGYYYIKCINNYVVDKTTENKNTIKDSRAKTAYEDIYKAYEASIKKEYNMELWNAVKVSEYKDTSTSNLFTIYQELDKN